jgi:hypothetical protein
VFDIIDARCDHEVHSVLPLVLYGTPTKCPDWATIFYRCIKTLGGRTAMHIFGFKCTAYLNWFKYSRINFKLFKSMH